jgi:hypothetical protein
MDYETQKASIRKLSALENIRYVFTAHSGFTQDFGRTFGYWRTAPAAKAAPVEEVIMQYREMGKTGDKVFLARRFRHAGCFPKGYGKAAEYTSGAAKTDPHRLLQHGAGTLK